jgi:hypothetical protein
VKLHDDLISATRIGVMALRHGKQGPLGSARPGQRNRDPSQRPTARAVSFRDPELPLLISL